MPRCAPAGRTSSAVASVAHVARADEGAEGVGEDVGDETTKGAGGWRREDAAGEGEIATGDEARR